MANVMRSVFPAVGGLALASRIAWRSEPTAWPGTLSLVLVTPKGEAGATAVAANGDVLLSGPVTVADTAWLLSSGVVRVSVAVKLWVPVVRAGVVTVPRNWAAGPPELLLA